MTILTYVVEGKEFMSPSEAAKEAARLGTTKITKRFQPAEITLDELMVKRQKAREIQ